MKRIINSFLIVAIGIILAAATSSVIPKSFQLSGLVSILSILIFASLIGSVFFLISHWLDLLHPKIGLIIILGIGFCLRLCWLVSIHNEQVSDFAIYAELSKALVAGKGYTLTGPVGAEDLIRYLGPDKHLPYTTANRAPGAPLWGAFLFKIFGSHKISYLISNLLLGTGTIWLLYLLLEKNRFWARRAALLWVFYPPAFMAVNLFGTETLFSFSLLLTAYLISHWKEDNPFKYPLIGAAVGWTALVRSMLLPLCASVLLTIIPANKPRQILQKTGIFFLFLILTLSPWTIRNWKVFHRFIPVCTMEGEFLGRHTSNLLPEALKDEKWRVRYAAWRNTPNEADRSSEGYRIAVDNWLRILRGGPLQVIHCLWLGSKAAFADDVDILFWSVRRSYFLVRNPGEEFVLSKNGLLKWAWFSSGFYLLVILLAFCGAAFSLYKKSFFVEHQLFLSCYFLIFFLAHSLVLGLTRYHFSVMTVLVMLAGIGIYGSQSKIASSK